MGLRYNRRVRVAPGLRLNLSKSGIGYSIGRRGMWFTKRADGVRQATVGLPSTGLSYTARTNADNGVPGQPAQHAPHPDAHPAGLVWTAPPGWPAPTQGWAPVTGWQPDPSWPPVPDSWLWWQPATHAPETSWHTMKTTGRPRRSSGAVVAALLLFFPLGLFWMWRDQRWSSGLRWTVTAFASLILLIGAFSSPPKTTVAANNHTTASDQAATQAPSQSPSVAAEPTAAAIVAPPAPRIPVQALPVRLA